jgi:hypothetical protein
MSNFLKDFQNYLLRARDTLKVQWSMPPNRTSALWADIFHKNMLLDPVDMIARDFSVCTFKLFNKVQYRVDPQNAKPIGDSPIFDLWENPMPDHPEIDIQTILYLTSAYYEILGECFWLIDKDEQGKPAGIFIIPPEWMLLTPTTAVPYFRVQPLGNTAYKYFNADPEDVVWFKSPDLVNPYGRGRGHAEPMGDAIDTHEYSEKYAKRLFYNDATPPVIFEMPGISQPDADKFKESWMQKFGGLLNAYKPGIVSQKDFKVHQLATSPKEMDFVESRKYLVQTANEHWCVPPEMRGNLQNSNRATINAAYYLWTKNVVLKRLRVFASILNTQFVPMFDKTQKLVYDEIVPEDNDAKMKIANDGLSVGTLTLNEWRKIASTCGVQLLPDTQRGDVYLRQFSVTEVPANKKEAITEPVEEPVKPIKEDTPAGETIDLGKCIAEIEAKTKAMEKSTYTDDQKTAFWKSFDNKATAHEPLFEKAVSKFAGTQQKIVKDKLKNITDVKEIDSVLDSVFNDKSNEAFKRSLAPAWLATMNAGKDIAQSSLKSKKSVKNDSQVYNKLFNMWVDKNGMQKCTDMNETTKTKLAKRLSASIEEGQGIQQQITNILDACDGVYDEMTTTRATLIARTESCSTENFGIVSTYKIEGIQQKEFLATKDDRTREAHADADGQIVGIDEKFNVGGEQMDYPGDPECSAANICECRCTMLAVIE